MKKLPIGIQTFSEIRTCGYYYVDKTPLVAHMVDNGKYYFLSRPRRFGKSLLISTLADAFSGKKDLFQGLHLEDNWDWSRPSPVIRLDFAEGLIKSSHRLHERLNRILDLQAHRYQVDLRCPQPDDRLEELILALHQKTGERVVVLVDEYDKPILDSITEPDLALELRDGLRNIYSVLKTQDEYLRFVLLTGVSKFSKVSLFSGLNNLKDITLDKRYSSICGYTQEELETVFTERLTGVDTEAVRQWYNGYNWLGEWVYNPFDILLYLDSLEFANYWFETATPTFLIKLLQDRHYFMPALERLEVTEKIIGSFDVDCLEIEALLFQTGYLTIKSCQRLSGLRRFELGFPNKEVKQSLTDSILSLLTSAPLRAEANKLHIYRALEDNDLDGLGKCFKSFFASIPNEWYRKNQLARYEGFYASIVYCYFSALGLDVRPEESTNQGRIDLIIRFSDRVYILEFKVLEQSGPVRALEQIKEKGYAEKFSGLKTYLIGVEFSSHTRNIEHYEWEARGLKNVDRDPWTVDRDRC